MQAHRLARSSQKRPDELARAPGDSLQPPQPRAAQEIHENGLRAVVRGVARGDDAAPRVCCRLPEKPKPFIPGRRLRRLRTQRSGLPSQQTDTQGLTEIPDESRILLRFGAHRVIEVRREDLPSSGWRKIQKRPDQTYAVSPAGDGRKHPVPRSDQIPDPDVFQYQFKEAWPIHLRWQGTPPTPGRQHAWHAPTPPSIDRACGVGVTSPRPLTRKSAAGPFIAASGSEPSVADS